MEATFEEIISANYAQGEADTAATLQIVGYVNEASTVNGFRERDQWLAITARQRAAELFGR